MVKTVCVVGAGPAGLVAAKNLIHNTTPGTFKVTIYDAQPRLGGLWPESPTDNSGHIHPLMITNQSKHTVQFSDFAYKPYVQQFPRAWQVGEYLKEYAAQFLDSRPDVELRFFSRIEKAAQVKKLTGNGWVIDVRNRVGQVETMTFDFLIVGSGYFGKPVIPKALQGVETEIPIIHSSEYRNLEGMLNGNRRQGGKILVIGGQMSGVEITGTIATHLSSAANGVKPSSIPNLDRYTLHHLVQRPIWVFPTYTTPVAASHAPPFLPLDLSSYNLAYREMPMVNKQGEITEDAAIAINNVIYQPLLGTDQSEYATVLSPTDEERREPPFIAVSDPYLEFVRSKVITVSRGRLEKLDGNTASISGPSAELDDVAAIVLATGFDATHSVDYLPADVLKTLSITPDDIDNTFHLAFHATHHPQVNNLGFVGFYRSPYWGVMEMQARFVTALFTASSVDSSRLSQSMAMALQTDTSIQRSLSLRQNPRQAQFPMGDYPWLMNEFATALDMRIQKLPRAPPLLPPAHVPLDVLSPARYFTEIQGDEKLAEAARAAQEANLLDTCTVLWASPMDGAFIAKAVFRSLQGDWKVERSIVSRDSNNWTGLFEGRAQFLIRDGTIDGREAEFDWGARSTLLNTSADDKVAEVYGRDMGHEYLYLEQGIFHPVGQSPMPATKSYVWRYDELRDKLSVWFPKTGRDERRKVDYLFHELDFKLQWDGPEEGSAGAWEIPVVEEKGWEATGGHLCVADYYDAKYEFFFNAVNLQWWTQEYSVRGPTKDYTIASRYTR